jgi:pimeloyl-ACP methyl ester carboxylesterase
MTLRTSSELGWRALRLRTDEGDVELLHHAATDARAGVVLLGGVGGGWDTPARDLYPRLGADLADAGIATLRVRFREPGRLDACASDACAALEHLRGLRLRPLALVGHSFGGAVALRAAAACPDDVRAVVTLATQSGGTDCADQLGDGCALLLVHGMADLVLSAACSERVHERARPPKRLVLLARAGHCLDESAREVHALVRDHLVRALTPRGRSARVARSSSERRRG